MPGGFSAARGSFRDLSGCSGRRGLGAVYERSRILEDTLASAVRDGACPVLPTRGQKPAGGSFACRGILRAGGFRTPYTLPKVLCAWSSQELRLTPFTRLGRHRGRPRDSEHPQLGCCHGGGTPTSTAALRSLSMSILGAPRAHVTQRTSCSHLRRHPT
ncbi:uncharacterized protein LOC132658437 [Ovis aries]|uniref:uncharacterized protein LOC132658437 n=1 Tax=Ovis aries TaxID=9940 RepID=UPI00295270AF|nr:uncharacterized protein LOC132658437 [Ovis aries]